MSKEKTDFTNFATEYPNYFPGQYLLEDDFELQQKYLSDRQKYYNHSLHVSGIIEGLEVEAIQDKKAVLIKSGSAINSQGELIVLKKDINFSDFKDITNGELYIQYFEEKQFKQQEDIADSYTRWVEKPLIAFAATTPNNAVKLASLTIFETTVAVDAKIREYSGLSLPNSNSKELTLRSGGNTHPNLAVLTGSLKIDEDLAIDGNLTVNSTGTSAFAGSLTVSGTIIGTQLQIINVNQNADGNTLILGQTNQSHLKLGYHQNYSWIQSHGSKPLAINPIGNNVGIGTNNPGDYKLNVQGNQYINGSLTVNGTVQLGGFTDADQDEWPKFTWYRDISKNWDEGLIKHSTQRGKFQRAGYGIHLDKSREFGFWSTNWDALFAVEGATGNTYIKGNSEIGGDLTIRAGKVNLAGNQQITFSDTDITNNLKLQLWSGYGLGINGNTLFYTADGNHSWRDDNNNQRMLLTTAANGGLTVTGTGTSSFAGKLTVNGEVRADGGFIVDGNRVIDANAGWHRSYGNTGWYNGTYRGGWYMTDSTWIRSYNNKSIYHNTGILRTDGTFQVGGGGDRFIVNTSGNVGIGDTTPKDKLEIRGGLRLSNNSNYCRMYVSGNNALIFHLNRSHHGNNRKISWDGDTNLDSVSDISLKTDIEKETNILNRLLQLDVKNYRWKDNPQATTKKIGFIAQDVKPLFPSLVGQIQDEETDDAPTLTLKYAEFGVLAIGGLKELKQQKDAEIAELKTKIDAEINNLKTQIKQLMKSK